MNTFECKPETPWGIHESVRNDEPCPRCGWTAPGPKSDADQRASTLAAAIAAEHGWTLIEGGVHDEPAPHRQSRAA